MNLRCGVLAIVVTFTLLDKQVFARDNLDIDSSRQQVASSFTNAYRVTNFQIKSRWGGRLSVPLRNGDLWTPEKQSEVFAAIRAAFDSEQSQSYLLNQAGEAGVLYVDVLEAKDEASHTVALTFRVLRVRLSFARIGDNVLPVPRSAAATLYEAVPAPLLALNPVIGLTYDRAFGAALTGGFHDDLLTLPDTFKGRLPQHDNPDHLDARFTGSKSLENFYRANAGLAYSYRRIGQLLQDLSFQADYDGATEPLARQNHRNQTIGANGGATFHFAAHTRLTFNAGYRHAKDLLKGTTNRFQTDTEVQPNRVLIESLLPQPIGGFLRAAVWEDNGWTDKGIGFHQRLVGRIGYARELPVSPNQTIGVELLGGGGRLWGEAPTSRRYFGGNSSSQFLYDGVSEAGLLNPPTGPLIRSFGQGEAVGSGVGAKRGGNAFWHLNMNLTLPIRRLSWPLIPDEDEVRRRLKNGINVSGRSFLISALKQQGMSREEAIKEADRTLDEIRPATEFVIDEANLYSLKPLLMFDAGGLAGAGSNPTWLAAGGGIQLTLVTAKFELGYMRTVQGPTAGDRGNFFFRLVFQNLF